jgi:BMFP domain-containing protein YqiC
VDRERQRSKELELRVEELEQKLSKIQTEFV